MDHLFETRFSELLVTYGEKIALAIICLIVGKIVINLIIGAVGRVKYFNKTMLIRQQRATSIHS